MLWCSGLAAPAFGPRCALGARARLAHTVVFGDTYGSPHARRAHRRTTRVRVKPAAKKKRAAPVTTATTTPGGSARETPAAMAAQVLRCPNGAVGSGFLDSDGAPTVRALQRLQSQLTRLDRERCVAESCAAGVEADIAAQDIALARLAAEADAADETSGEDELDAGRAATVAEADAAEAELRRAEGRRADAIARLAAAAAAAQARRATATPGTPRAVAHAWRIPAPRPWPRIANDRRPPWACGARGMRRGAAAADAAAADATPPPAPVHARTGPRGPRRAELGKPTRGLDRCRASFSNPGHEIRPCTRRLHQIRGGM